MKIINDTLKFIKNNGSTYISTITSMSTFQVFILFWVFLVSFLAGGPMPKMITPVMIIETVILFSLIFFVLFEMTYFVSALIPFIILISIAERITAFQKQSFFIICWIFISVFVYFIMSLMSFPDNLNIQNEKLPYFTSFDVLFIMFIIAGIIAGMVCWRLKKDKFGPNPESLPDNS